MESFHGNEIYYIIKNTFFKVLSATVYRNNTFNIHSVVIAGGMLAGLPVLSVLYHVDLSG